MPYTFDIHVSQKDADLALRRFIFREAGLGLLIAILVCIGYITYDLADGSLSIIGVVILTILFILAIIYTVAIVSRRKQMKELLERLGDAPVSYTLNDEELSTESTLGSSTLKWNMIKKLWIDPDLTLVFYSRSGYTTIPTSQIPSDALNFLSKQIKLSGGSILNKQ